MVSTLFFASAFWNAVIKDCATSVEADLSFLGDDSKYNNWLIFISFGVLDV